MKNTILLIFSFLSLSACSVRDKSTYTEFKNYVSNPENGLVKDKNVNGISIQVKFLPNDYLVYKDFSNLEKNEISNSSIDSLKEIYANNFTFVLTIGPSSTAEQKGDIMLGGVKSLEEFRERVSVMNFDFDQLLELQCDEKVVAPSLVSLENIYGMKDSRSFLIIFPRHLMEKNTNDFMLTFNDEFFATGLNKFKFYKADIEAVPGIDFSKVVL